MLHILKTDLLKEKDTDTPLTKDIKKRIVEDITNRYTESKLAEDVIVMLRIASFLDPVLKQSIWNSLVKVNCIMLNREL